MCYLCGDDVGTSQTDNHTGQSSGCLSVTESVVETTVVEPKIESTWFDWFLLVME